jgi:hypothetical protein
LSGSGVAFGVLAVALVVAGCAGTDPAPGGPPTRVASTPGAAAMACAHAVSGSPAAESCETAVGRLNGTLAAALNQMLPTNAETISNLILPDNPAQQLGATFFPRQDSDGRLKFEAPVRVRAGLRTGILELSLLRYRAIPPTDDCPDKVRLAEMASKGVTQHRCDRVTVKGAVVVVRDSSEPFGSGEYAGLLLHHLNVTAYRPDGMQVTATLSPVVERLPEDADARRAAIENMLTLAQLQALALDPSFVFA